MDHLRQAHRSGQTLSMPLQSLQERRKDGHLANIYINIQLIFYKYCEWKNKEFNEIKKQNWFRWHGELGKEQLSSFQKKWHSTWDLEDEKNGVQIILGRGDSLWEA